MRPSRELSRNGRVQWLFFRCLSLCWLCSSASDSSCLSFLLSILSLERFRDFLLVFLRKWDSLCCFIFFADCEWWSILSFWTSFFMLFVIVNASCKVFHRILKHYFKWRLSSVFECKNECTKHESFSSDHESLSESESWNFIDVHICQKIYDPESDQSSEAVSDKSGKKSVAFHMWKSEEIEFLSMRECKASVLYIQKMLCTLSSRDWLHSKIDESLSSACILVFVHREYISLVVFSKPHPREALRNDLILLSRHIESTSWSTSTWKTSLTSQSWSSCCTCSWDWSRYCKKCNDIFHHKWKNKE